MAVVAVQGELVSGLISLLYREFTGKSYDFGSVIAGSGKSGGLEH